MFRPTEPVRLPEGTLVQAHAPDEAVDARVLVPPGTNAALVRAYEILGRRVDSGHHDTAERHNDMNAVFLDTVGLIAVWDKADQWRDDVERPFLQLAASGRAIVTTTLVLYECGNAVARRPDRSTVDDLRVWLASRGWLLEPSASDLDAAWADYWAATVGAAGIVDHVSFVVMRRLGRTEAFANDRHFQEAGFTVLF